MTQVATRARTNLEAAGELKQGADALREAADATRAQIARFQI